MQISLTDFNNAVVSMVPVCPPISNSSSPFPKPLGIVPSEGITIGITVSFMFHSFFIRWQGLNISLVVRSLWFSLCDPPEQQLLPLLLLLLFIVSFPYQPQLMVFHWILSDNKSLRPQDSPQYSGWSKQCCSLDGFRLSSYFQALDSEWQQISSSVQDSPEYSGLSMQCCSLDGFHLPSCFQALESEWQQVSSSLYDSSHYSGQS